MKVAIEVNTLRRIASVSSMLVANMAFVATPMCGILADEIDPSTGWYLKASCSDSFYGASTNMMYWAKGSPSGESGVSTVGLSEGENYFVEGGKRFTTSREEGHVFPGASLTIGNDSSGAILCLRGKSQTYRNLILNRGSVTHTISRSTERNINSYDNLLGETTVKSRKEDPVVVNAAYQNLWMIWAGKLIGDEDAGMSIGSPDGTKTNMLVSVTNAASYYGDIVVTSKFVNTGKVFGSGLGVDGPIPGTVRIKGGSIIKPYNQQAVADLGELHMDEGTEMRFVYDSSAMTGGLIRVSRALTLPGKVRVRALTGAVSTRWTPAVSTTGEEVRSPFLVGPPGVRIDSDTFEFVPEPDFEPQKADKIYPQRVRFETETDPVSGRDTVYAVIEPIVEMTKAQDDVRTNADALNQGTALTNATFWSDGRVPHTNAHYVINKRLLSPYESDVEYEFPGKSLLFYKGAFTVFGTNHRLNIPDFQMASGIRQGQFATVTICGGLVRLCGEQVSMRSWGNKTLTIESEIVGAANLRLEGEGVTSSSHGHFAFTGLNTNWFGKIAVVAPNNASVDDWNTDYLTIHLYDGRNLGGRLAEFDYGALELGRLCDLYAHTNVTLDAAANRGIFLSHEQGARISVDEGYTLDCRWPISFNGPLYKTQTGTLALGGGVKFCEVEGAVTNITDTLPNDPSKRLLVVTNGTLKALTHDCVNGLTVALATNATTLLALDFVEENGNLKKYGFYNVKTDTPFEAGKPINIQLNGIDGEKVKEWGGYKQGLVTVKTTAANVLGMDELINFKKPVVSGIPNVRLVRDDDPDTGLTTYSAYCKFVGMQMIFR